jgi:RimJ/RimL family protein N-acetyltransferase
MKNPFLIGDKIYLRPLEPSDAAVMATWMNDGDVTRTLNMYRPVNEEGERGFVERATRSDNDIHLAIMTRHGDKFIGTVGLMRIHWRERIACFGISIGDKACWGQGYGTEATRLLTGYAFETLNLNRVWLHVFAFNHAGIRAYENVGYRREGVLRQAAFREGAFHDVYSMAVLREEWSPRRPARRPARPKGRARRPARPRRSSR